MESMNAAKNVAVKLLGRTYFPPHIDSERAHNVKSSLWCLLLNLMTGVAILTSFLTQNKWLDKTVHRKPSLPILIVVRNTREQFPLEQFKECIEPIIITPEKFAVFSEAISVDFLAYSPKMANNL